MSMDEIRLVALCKLFKDGNFELFDEFVESTKKVIYYNIFSYTNNSAVSEDLLQDTYVKFLEGIETLDLSKSIVGLLLVISKNLALNYIKRESKKDDYENYEYSNGNEDIYKDDEETLLRKIKLILKPKEYEVFVLYNCSELTLNEISKSKGIPLGTVTWLYNQAIKKLRKELKI
mgnify:CR=1 FL=1